MNPENLKVLAERAATIEGRPTERLDAVHVRIAQARRRRQVGAIGAAVLAVVLALTAGVAVLALMDPHENGPVKPAPRPTPTSTPTRLEVEEPSVRRLTYAVGHTIHWGDRTIDAGRKVWEVAATDDGVVFIRDSKHNGCPYGDLCRTLWFTDGSETFSIGHVTGSIIRGFDVQLANAGSTVVWGEPDPRSLEPYYPGREQYVVYDTGRRRVAGRFGNERSEILAVLDDYVYWIPGQRAWCLDFQPYYGTCRRYRGVMRFDLSTGTQRRVSWASYRADRGSRERTVVTPFMHEGGVPEPVLSDTVAFVARGRHLVTDDGNGTAITARLASTGQVLQFRLPAGYQGGDYYPMLMWLDDDRVVISAGAPGLMVCRVSSGRCRGGAVAGEVETGFGGHG